LMKVPKPPKVYVRKPRKPHSEETKRKISAALRRRHAGGGAPSTSPP
jgi:hypothetical protein